MDLRDEITRRMWRFHYEGGGDICRIMQLVRDGLIVNFDARNEKSWAIRHGKFVFINEHGIVSSRFDVVTETSGRIQLVGPHLLGDRRFNVVLTSYLAYNPSLPDQASCHIRVELGRSAKSLVITLNSRGFCYNGDTRQTNLEMTGFGPSLGLDTIHIAEHEGRCAWYADKIEYLTKTLAPLFAGYQQLFFIGMSSGGYGAILLAERLAGSVTAQCISISINPQTTLLKKHYEEIAKRFPPRLLPLGIADDALLACVKEHLHLPDIISSGPGLVSHNIFFDSGNGAECYYAALLEGVRGCHMIGIPLGLTHPQGIGRIYEMNMPHQIAKDAIMALEINVQEQLNQQDERH